MAPGNQPGFPGELSLRDADVSDEDAVSLFFLMSHVKLISLFCVAVVECPDPNVLISGNVSPPQEKYYVDNETTYECDSGYTLRGSSRRICLPNGKWSGSTPICSRDSRPHMHAFLLSPRSPLSPHRSWILSCSSMQRGITVPILVFQLVPWDQATFLELMTKSNTAASTNCSWWDRVKGNVWRAANGQAMNPHVTVRHTLLCISYLFAMT